MQAVFSCNSTNEPSSLGVNECNPLDTYTELARMYNHNEWDSYYQMSSCQTGSNSSFHIFCIPVFFSVDLSHFAINLNFRPDDF